MTSENAKLTQTLINLGLTRLQAKTYLALITLGKADAKRSSKASGVVREEIYRVMPKLEKSGLVEKIIARPTLYKALPLKEGLTLLVQKRTEENFELQEQTRALINNLNEYTLRSTSHEKSSQFIITSESKLFRKRFDKFIQTAQSKIDVLATPDDVQRMVFHHFKYFQNAMMNKGVEIRVLTEKIEKETKSGDIGELKKNPLFKLKHLDAFVPVTIALFDDKEVSIRISHGVVPSLWSNNPEITKLASYCFNEVWSKT